MSIAQIQQREDSAGFDLVRDPDTGLVRTVSTDQERQVALTIMSIFSNKLAAEADELPAGTNDRRGYWGDYLLPRIQGVVDRLGSKMWTLSREKILQEVVARAEGFVVEALEWKLTTGEVLTVDVTVVANGERLEVMVVETTPDGTFENSYTFDWRR